MGNSQPLAGDKRAVEDSQLLAGNKQAVEDSQPLAEGKQAVEDSQMPAGDKRAVREAQAVDRLVADRNPASIRKRLKKADIVPSCLKQIVRQARPCRSWGKLRCCQKPLCHNVHR